MHRYSFVKDMTKKGFGMFGLSAKNAAVAVRPTNAREVIIDL